MEAINTSETLVNFYEATRRDIPPAAMWTRNLTYDVVSSYVI
jgi:hypothetical protein